MDELFSCRNCIHNPSQGLHIGPDDGYCLQHRSVLTEPLRTTCKYLHRMDLPWFDVDEGIREHAAEFAAHEGIVRLEDHSDVARVPYSEKHVWFKRQFDPVVQAVAQYGRMEEANWTYIRAFAGGVDGRRVLCHAGLVRRYQHRCNSWRSSYRLMLGVIDSLVANDLVFNRRDLWSGFSLPDETANEARWEVVFGAFSALSEFGWHASLEDLMYPLERLNGALAEYDWEALQPAMDEAGQAWRDLVIEHAQAHGEFFPEDPIAPSLSSSG